MLKIITGILLLLYPFLVYIGLTRFDPRYLGLLLVLLALVRFVFSEARNQQSIALLCVAVLAGAVSVISGSEYGVLLYPSMVSLSFLGVFSYSLWFPPSMVERFARLHDKNFQDEAIAYTRKVTWVWCVFFLMNALVSLMTVWLLRDYWLLYNGLVSYLLMGMLFGAEYLVRIKVKRSHHV